MKKKMISALLCTAMTVSMISAGALSVYAEGVELDVVTTFAGEDSNAKNYQEGLEGWQETSGNTVNDNSATADETLIFIKIKNR
ncbi:MAG: hypothetical protein SOY73_05170 [Blautia sp.]|nr:hypothetical protein [Blautia sp.]MDY3998481.1 hypothetical protein [Blautia sp.]